MISKARAHLEPRDDDPLWLYWVSPADITACAGNCLLRLGQADRAATLIEEGVTLFDGSFVRDRQLFSIHLADALTRPGKQRDLHAAADWGMVAIHLAETLDSRRNTDLLRHLCHQMKPHAKVPAVGDFLDQTRGLTQR